MENEKPEQQMQVLEGNPIEVVLFGQKHTVQKFSIKKQREALLAIQKLAETREGVAPVEWSVSMMLKLLSISTGIAESEIEEKADMIELAEAFSKIWRQNRFDFLLKTIAQVGDELNGTAKA